MHNRIFFPQEALDQWLVEGLVDLQQTTLCIVPEARRYRLAEALHITREVTGTPDPNELVGRVKSRPFLGELGAEILETSMIIGENAYDVVPGWLATPVGSFDEHRASGERARAQAGMASVDETPSSDEELLTRLLIRRT